MNEREKRQLDDMVGKLSNLSQLSKEQSLLLELYYKRGLGRDEEKILLKLLKAERTAEKHKLAVLEMENAIRNDKSRKQKFETKKKIIIGSAMLKAIEKDVRFKQTFEILCDSFMTEDEREIFVEKPKMEIEFRRVTFY